MCCGGCAVWSMTAEYIFGCCCFVCREGSGRECVCVRSGIYVHVVSKFFQVIMKKLRNNSWLMQYFRAQLLHKVVSFKVLQA